MTIWKRFTVVWTILLALVAGMDCRAGGIEARLDRDTVEAGQGALLTVRISGRVSGNPQMPEVENFIFQSEGQSQQYNSVNGVVSRSVIYRYAVGSQVPGEYEIPGISMEVDGEEISTGPLKLQVLAVGGARPPAGAAPGAPAPDETEPTEDPDRFGFLSVELLTGKRKHVYMGEIAPVKIEAWIPAEGQAQVRSGIQPEGKAFTLHNVSEKPAQTTKVRKGRQYIVVTWYGGISATKAGSHPVSLSLDATVAVRDTSRTQRRSRRGGAFDDPFFDDIFERMNPPMIQKNVTLASRDEEIEVRLLPDEGKPGGFSGAVGNFKLADAKIPGEWKTGEPQSLEATVTGTGNFALLDEPELVPADGWKVYSGKSDFTPGDVASFAGTKEFRFSAVPGKHGSQEIALELSYFDPNAGKYETVRSGLQKVEIIGEDIVVKDEVAEVETKAVERDPDQLIGQRDRVSGSWKTLLPLVSRPLFAGLLGGAAVLCCAGVGLGILRVRREDPDRIRKEMLDARMREAMTGVEEAKDQGGLFAAGRHVLQLRLGALWERPAEAITSAEVRERLPSGSPVVAFFEESDRQSYGRASEAGDLRKGRALLDAALLDPNLNPKAK